MTTRAPQLAVWALYGAIVVIAVAAFDLSIVYAYAPPVEGWWSFYAWALDHGLNWYRDVYLVFPPLHALIARFVWVQFGHDFIDLRLAGIAIHALNVLLLYAWLARLFLSKAAMVASATVAFWIMQNNTAYISGDYHTTVSLFVSLGLLSTTFSNERALKPVAAFTLGLACAGLLLTKQNVGVFFTAAALVFLVAGLWDAHDSRRSTRPAIIALSWATIAIALGVLLPTAMIGRDWLTSYQDVQAKGSMLHVLLRFATDRPTRSTILAALLVAFAWRMPAALAASLDSGTNNNYKERLRGAVRHAEALFGPHIVILSFRIAILAVAFLVVRFHPSSWIFSLAIATVILATLDQWKLGHGHPPWIKYGFVFLGALGYAGTMTAGLNPVSMEHIVAFWIARSAFELPPMSAIIPTGLYQRLPALATIAVCGFLYASKVNGPYYNWWGLRHSNVATTVLDVEYVRGLKADEDAAAFFQEIRDLKARIGPTQSVFAYPSIPAVYMILDRAPPAGVPVLWFDVINDQVKDKVLAELNATKPAYVIWLLPPHSVYVGHAKLKNRTSLMHFVDGWLYSQIAAGHYKMESYREWSPASGQLPLDVIKSRLLEIFVASDRISCSNVDRWLKRTGAALNSNTICDVGETVPRGQKIKMIFDGEEQFSEALAQRKVGIVTDGSYDRYQFIVLRRVD